MRENPRPTGNRGAGSPLNRGSFVGNIVFVVCFAKCMRLRPSARPGRYKLGRTRVQLVVELREVQRLRPDFRPGKYIRERTRVPPEIAVRSFTEPRFIRWERCYCGPFRKVQRLRPRSRQGTTSCPAVEDE